METASRDTDHHIGLPALRVAVAASEHEETQLKDELLAVLLHDLRSPLGAVGVLTDLISSILTRGDVPDSRQLELLQESVIKTQRVLDDAVEIQSIIRGSSTFTPSVVALDCLIDACIEKASHAPYFRNTTIKSHVAPDRFFVRADLEKMETSILCLLEQIIACSPGAPDLHISAEVAGDDVILSLKTREKSKTGCTHQKVSADNRALRGRLGNRRLGESRYSFQICRKVLSLMGGQVKITESEFLGMEIRLPLATP